MKMEDIVLDKIDKSLSRPYDVQAQRNTDDYIAKLHKAGDEHPFERVKRLVQEFKALQKRQERRRVNTTKQDVV
jgi:hypothetical protein